MISPQGPQNPTQCLQDGKCWATGRHQFLITLLLVCEKWMRSWERRPGEAWEVVLGFPSLGVWVARWCGVGGSCPGCRPCWSLGSCAG